MADIPTLGPWIPGQQLYGSMIPRPEHEALLYKDEAERVRAHLLAFEKRVKAIMAGNGNNKEDRLRLRNLEMFDMSIPRTLGYEVVPFGEHRDGEEPLNEAKEDGSLGSSSIVRRRILPKLFLSKRLSVIPTDDDHPTIGLDSPDQIVLECNQYSTYEITLCKRSESKMEEEDGEEEGVEIVAMGRLSTLMDLGESGRAKETINGDGGLSLMYQSSDRIHVAFFRPQGHRHRGKKLASKQDSPNEAKFTRLQVDELLIGTDETQGTKGVSIGLNKRLIMFLYLIVFSPFLWCGNVGPCQVAAIPSDSQGIRPSRVESNPNAFGGGSSQSDDTIKEIVGILLRWRGADDDTNRSSQPFVTLTYAQSMDGCIGLRSEDIGSSRDKSDGSSSNFPISGPESKKLTHALRSIHDAILVGGNTFLIDNPRLTNRLWQQHPTGMCHQPRPVVLDTNLRHLKELNERVGNCLAQNLIVYCSHEAYQRENVTKLIAKVGNDISIRPCVTSTINGHPCLDLCDVLLDLKTQFGIQSIMVEGGARILSEFVKQKLVTAICITIAPIWLGSKGIIALQDMTQSSLSTSEKEEPAAPHEIKKQAIVDLTRGNTVPPRWYTLGNDNILLSKWNSLR